MNVNFLLDKVTIDRNTVFSHLHKLFKVLSLKLSEIDTNSLDKAFCHELHQLQKSILFVRGNLYYLNSSLSMAITYFERTVSQYQNDSSLCDFMIFLCYMNKTISRKNEDPQKTFGLAMNFFRSFSQKEEEWIEPP